MQFDVRCRSHAKGTRFCGRDLGTRIIETFKASGPRYSAGELARSAPTEAGWSLRRCLNSRHGTLLLDAHTETTFEGFAPRSENSRNFESMDLTPFMWRV